MKKIFTIIIMAMGISFSLVAQNSLNTTLIGHYDTPNYAFEVAISGNYAYVADFQAGLRIIDISNPASPHEVGFYDTLEYAEGVAVNGNYAYVTDTYDGFCIIDISNPVSPQKVGLYNTLGTVFDIAISGNYVYIANWDAGLRIIDISNPAIPQEVGFYDTPGYAYGVAVSENYAYIADGYALRIIDISNPVSPFEIGSCDIPDNVREIAVNGNYAYIAHGNAGLRIIDISSPASPQEVGFCDTPEYAEGVAVNGNYAYIADAGTGLRIIDISNPASPQEVGFYDTPANACGVSVSGNYAYIANGVAGMFIIQNDLLVGSSINGIISYANTSNTPLNDITVDLKNSNGAIVASTATNATGGYIFSNVANGDYALQVTSAKPWNGVTAGDVLLYKKHIVGLISLNGIYFASGDVNGSGSLTAGDVLLIKKRIATTISSFSVGDWLFNNDTLSINGSNVTYNFNGLVYGDANGSYIPAEVDLSAVKEQGIISMETVNDVEGEIIVPVHVLDMPNLGSFQFTIAYDPGKIQFTGVDHWYDGINDVTVGNTAPGQLTFVWAADDRGINIADGTLCNLRFTTKASGQSTLSFENNPTLKEFSDYEGNLFEPKYTNGVVGSTTGISEQNLTEISVYPNPSNGTFTLELISVKSQNFDVTVYNPLGVAVYQQLNVAANGKYSTEIGSGDLPEGIYTLTVTGKDTNYIKKIVIRK